MGKRALITGISGQDGSYLAELLIDAGYEVHGIVRRVALEYPEHRLWRIRHLLNKLELHAASLESYPSLFKVIAKIKPDEIYHLAAQSFVGSSFEDEFSTLKTNIDGTHFMLAAMKELAPNTRFYFAASSEMFGDTNVVPQDESTPFRPRSAYGISKLAGYHLTRNYREAYKIHACCGILYNHESPRRGLEFVSRKITSQAAKIKLKLSSEVRLGNLDARRDWGHAQDYVKAMWLMLQQNEPDDYVICSGESHSVRELLDKAFGFVGLNPDTYLVVDKKLIRPSEVSTLQGNSLKARTKLGWKYERTFEDLISEMVNADLRVFANACQSEVGMSASPNQF